MKGKPSLINKNSRGRELYLRESETRELIQIPRKSGKDTEKRLGVMSSCDGRWTMEYNEWRRFSKEFGKKIRYSRIGRTAGYVAYHSLWMAKFRYSAPVIGFSNNQLEKIQQQIISPCISVAGYCSKIPRAIVYGPSRYGGMNWSNIKVVSLYEKIKMFVGSVRLQDKVGQMLEIQLSWLQLFAGTQLPILQERTEVPYLPEGWLKNLHQQLTKNEIQIEVSETWRVTKQREEDKVIMDEVRHQMPQWTWGGMNRCRLFLKATTIADLTTINGKFIPLEVRQVKGPLRETKLTFPLQRRPGKEDVRQWEYFINSISVNGHIHLPLGRWTRNPDQVFTYLYYHPTEVIYKQTTGGWTVYGGQRNSKRRCKKLKIKVGNPPTHCTPVRVIDGETYLIRLPEEDIHKRSRDKHKSQAIGKKKRIERDIIGKWNKDKTNLEKLKQQWKTQECKIICATDGGLKDGVGTSSYTIFLPNDPQPALEGHAAEYQPHEWASSTRQELLGQLGLEIWLGKLKNKWGLPKKITMVLITDSKASIQIMENVIKCKGIKDTLRADMDVALEVHRYRVLNKWINREVVKVESHIEREQAPNQFFWECNERADELATTARDTFSKEILVEKPNVVWEGTKSVCPK